MQLTKFSSETRLFWWRFRCKISNMISRQRELFTFQFIKFDPALKPIESASGCVIRYEGVLFLLTVAHAIRSAKDWYLALEVVDGRGWKNDPIAPMNYLRRIRILSAKVQG